MHALARERPWIAAAVMARINRFRAAPRAVNTGAALLLIAVLVLMVLSFVVARQHRFGTLHASLRWWLAAGFFAWTVMLSRQRLRRDMAAHGRGWMQAWPLPPRKLQLEQATIAAAMALIIATWPAILSGLLMGAGAGTQIGLNLVGCCLGVLVGAGFGQWPAVGREVVADAAALALSSHASIQPFAGLSQLRAWQQRAIGRLSLRRWVLWVAPILLMAPSQITVQAAVQILLPLLVWPLYARAMAASLSTISRASRLLAATPLPPALLCKQLLPRPVVLALCLAIVLAIDLAWLRFPLLMVVAGPMLVLLFEGWRVASRCRHARKALMACVRPATMLDQGTPR